MFSATPSGSIWFVVSRDPWVASTYGVLTHVYSLPAFQAGELIQSRGAHYLSTQSAIARKVLVVSSEIALQAQVDVDVGIEEE